MCKIRGGFEQNKSPAKSMEKMPEKNIGWDRIKENEVINAKDARPNQKKEKPEYTPLRINTPETTENLRIKKGK